MAVKTIVGRLGGVPEVRAAGGKHVATFSVAETKRRFSREKNDWEDEFTIWHDVESWVAPNALAQLARGTLVIVLGEERDASYENREGKQVRKTVVRATSVGTVVREAAQQQAPAGGGWNTPTNSGEPF
ncbi:single-stranded DNA-binding protein [Microbacterium sp. CFBP 13617]|uniref:single-stranded DNA-binding protein n=1 Tax=Microbacterium sp. CFBP 13617 TaxID=2774035 RepID=UPI001787753D|nr:single-stranded DNA-binding protein [Microbacterium sp. CFBP 13617]MBD8218236.1 single-stranded DNA-binding protein [Microbacterium sp. CFBP 13617]